MKFFKAIAAIITLVSLLGWARGDVIEGGASWYDEGAGGPTASGVPFDPDRLEAAHKKLPFGTVVLVRKVGTDLVAKCVIVDRGPFIKGRIIDLTPAAAKKLDMVDQGVADVKVLILRVGSCKNVGQCKKDPFERGEKIGD